MRGKTLYGAALALAFAASGLAAQLTQPIPSNMMEAFRWRSIGPANIMGRVTDVQGLPSPSTTFYVLSAAGGVWKTTNNGTTFDPVWNVDSVSAMGAIGIAPSDPNQLWVGTGEEDSRNSISPGAGVYKSTDAGKTWQHIGLETAGLTGRIVIDPHDPDLVYAAIVGNIFGPNKERGVYRTKDGGKTWEQILAISENTGAIDITMDMKNPSTLIAAMWTVWRQP
jgi:hypothetical protein